VPPLRMPDKMFRLVLVVPANLTVADLNSMVGIRSGVEVVEFGPITRVIGGSNEEVIIEALGSGPKLRKDLLQFYKATGRKETTFASTLTKLRKAKAIKSEKGVFELLPLPRPRKTRQSKKEK